MASRFVPRHCEACGAEGTTNRFNFSDTDAGSINLCEACSERYKSLRGKELAALRSVKEARKQRQREAR